MTQSELTKQPFFARFMETQIKSSPAEVRNAEATAGEESEEAVTLKFPSDWDDSDWP
jgi:hypothetical protein